MKVLQLAAIAALFLFSSRILFAEEKVDARVRIALQQHSPTDEILAWIFFADKGTHEVLKSSVPPEVVSPRSFQRRLKARPFESAVDYTDLPVEQEYVAQIASKVHRVRQTSKWFNGVSVSATQRDIEQIETLPFVRRIELVARFKRSFAAEEATALQPSNPEPPTPNHALALDYGLSYNQLNQINVPAVHNTGNYAQGVIIGSFDNGFRLLNHDAFDSLRTRIVATYDFVDHKVSVVPNNPDPGFGAHGIITLSTLAGYKPGQLIGPAFGARFILARTENDSSETPFEEDNWLAAMEWADSLGVDVTSTSLGYLTYDPPYPSWTWQNMDGNTTVITRAADLAVSKGIVVVNSAGNNGFNNLHNTLNAPADGDSVLSIGALTTDGFRASFSSVGPTTSTPPRIKPDVMAQGVLVRCASSTNPTQYSYSQGTSLSCPLAAGVAALLIHAKPNASAIQIMNAMRQTASRAANPDNQYGWGTLNALSAITLLGGIAHGAETFGLFQDNTGTTTFTYALPQASNVSLRVYNVLGQEIKTLVNGQQAQGVQPVQWNGLNNDGNKVASGVYFIRLVAQGLATNVSFNQTIKISFVR